MSREILKLKVAELTDWTEEHKYGEDHHAHDNDLANLPNPITA
jgi:hypothetical protein